MVSIWRVLVLGLIWMNLFLKLIHTLWGGKQ